MGTLTLNDGRRIPQLGFGTYLLPPVDTERVVSDALEAGYRHIDTARYYRNEHGVGAALRSSGLRRHDVWITSKLPFAAETADDVRRAVDATTDELGTHVDLYLVHWPRPRHGRYPAVWNALQREQLAGRLRSIGVSNFHPAQLERILRDEGVLPAVNQIELHPYLPNRDLVTYCRSRGIAVEAWSPLGAVALLADATVRSIASEIGRSPAQVVLRWHLQHGYIALPKASTPERIIENLALTGWALDTNQMRRLARLDRGAAGRTGPHPKVCEGEPLVRHPHHRCIHRNRQPCRPRAGSCGTHRVCGHARTLDPERRPRRGAS